ncbi:Methyltransf-2 domain-containing protein [Fusarium sp. Ph1]|nr:Methyltransf-2 domain-containing protein [Fusarium sp. Ph1]
MASYDGKALLGPGIPGIYASLIFGVETGLWKLMAKNGDEPQVVHRLAADLDLDPLLLNRLMRHLASTGYLIETGECEYKITNFTRAMGFDILGNGYLAMISCMSAASIRFHEFTRKRGFQNPKDAEDTSLMMAYDTNLNIFEWLQSRGCDGHFNDHMACYRQGRMPWMHPCFYPVDERLVCGADVSPDAAFLVDIGGNRGHDLLEFQRHHPKTPGRLILQDLPAVIQGITAAMTGITIMEYDFHTEQPVRGEWPEEDCAADGQRRVLTTGNRNQGARAYYMHSCLHDWPDDVCRGILSRVSKAMKRGYSRLLINENVVPSKGAHWETTSLDIVMMTHVSSMERTENDWRELIEGMAGLKIVKIWHGGNGVESLIECELPAGPGDALGTNLA